MNKERVLALAVIVEKGHHKFNGIHAALHMGNWLGRKSNFFPEDWKSLFPVERIDLKDSPDVHNCNTIACMAGFTCLLFDYTEASKVDGYDVADHAKKLLEVTDEEAYSLFKWQTAKHITGPQAASVLRHFAETGEVDWWYVTARSAKVEEHVEERD